jgi:hypothetical protein
VVSSLFNSAIVSGAAVAFLSFVSAAVVQMLQVWLFVSHQKNAQLFAGFGLGIAVVAVRHGSMRLRLR